MINGISEVDEHIKRNTTLYRMGSVFSSPSHSNDIEKGHFYNNKKFMKTSSPLGPVDFSEKLNAMMSKPSPREDISVTRTSDEYMEYENLGTVDKASLGSSSSSSTINELLKSFPKSNVSAKELTEFLSDNPEVWKKDGIPLLLVKKLYQVYQLGKKNKEKIEQTEKNLNHRLDIESKNLESQIPIEDIFQLKQEITLLKEKLFGNPDEYSIDTSVAEELVALRSYIGPLLSLPDQLELLKRKSEELTDEETKELGYKIDDLIVKTDELQDRHDNLKDFLLDEINQTDNWVSRLNSELEEKISELGRKISEKPNASSALNKDELYSTVAVLREETKNKVTNLSVQTEKRFTDFDRRLSQSIMITKSDYNDLQTRAASLETALASIIKENRQLKEQVTQLSNPQNKEYSGLHTFGAIAFFVFLVLVIVACNS